MIFGSPFMRPFQAISGGQGGAQVPIFAAPLINNINPSIGTVTPTFTRETSSTYLDDSLVQTAGIGVPRFEPAGYLTEKLSTNNLFSSESLSTWSTTNITVDDNQAVSPTGDNTAAKMIDDSTSGVHRIFKSLTVASGNKYTLSVFAKKGTLDVLWLKETVDSSTNYFDLTNVTATGPDSPIIDSIGNGWYRCKITWPQSDTLSTSQIGVSETVGVAAYIGTGKYLYAFRPQLEYNGYMTSSIPTTISAVTRNRDQLDYDNTGGLALPNEFTMVFDMTPATDGDNYLPGEIRPFGSSDSRGSDYEIRPFGGVAYAYDEAVGGGTFTLKSSDLSKGTLLKFAIYLSQEDANSRAGIFTGGSEVLNVTQIQSLDHSNQLLNIGYWSGSNGAFNIKNVIVYQGKLSDSKLAYLTSL